MSLWIRSQDRKSLRKINNLEIEFLYFNQCHYKNGIPEKGGYSISSNGQILGQYKTEERALEILNDIQTKLKNKYLAKVNPILNQSDFKRAVKDMEEFNNIDLIGSNSLVDIQPINPEVIIYEMPEK